MRFEIIPAKKADIPVGRAYRVLGMSESGYYAWRSRQPSQSQKTDIVLLAHIRAGFLLHAKLTAARA